MQALYLPPSDFLNAIVEERVPLSGMADAERNLERLIVLTRDPDAANRDWATMLLGQQEIDTPGVRDALLQAAHDEHHVVRAEGVLGLAMRDPSLALPFVQAALRAEAVAPAMLEAAALCAHPSLIEDLKAWAEPSANTYVDDLAVEALAACQAAA
ncbi:HEAT repeat domain-containing protein [Caulobacter endophyticus]|uniref:HEAT repeat domain-containing protein n=1 Tax=Caulobacter endophyticus TaxID=2172652 RepID=UPI00240EABDD|nr:HEAT repeat domain-containing protein [Caulobacter endophyticus]MDG2527560.1 HEAT repeat domain-containing protein [Caulobacter endophyticus]